MAAGNDNLLTFAEAARRAGRYAAWIHDRLDAGELQAVIHLGRVYVDARSLSALLNRAATEEAYRGGGGIVGMNRMFALQREQDERDKALGLYQPRPEVTSPEKRDELGRDFLKKFGRSEP